MKSGMKRYTTLNKNRYVSYHIDPDDYIPSKECPKCKSWMLEHDGKRVCVICGHSEKYNLEEERLKMRNEEKERRQQRLEILKVEREQIEQMHCLCFDLKDKCLEWYDNEIRYIEEYENG